MSDFDYESLLSKNYHPESEPAADSSAEDFDYESLLTPKPTSGQQLKTAAKDIGVAMAKGLVAVPQAAVGLADLATGGEAGKRLELSGIDLNRAQKYLDNQYSSETQAANEAVQNASGFTGTLEAIKQHPRAAVFSGIESIPQMLAGGGIGRGVLAAERVAERVASKFIPGLTKVLGEKGAIALAAGIGEGTMTTSNLAEQIRYQNIPKL